MADMVPMAAALGNALALQTRLVNAKMRLYQSSYTPNPNTTRTELVAAEADFSNYPTAGKVVATWSDPVRDPSGGYGIESGLQQFTFVTPEEDEPVTNTIGGLWIETTAGVLVRVISFATPVSMSQDGNGIPALVKLLSPSV